jgi:hypothetical protein
MEWYNDLFYVILIFVIKVLLNMEFNNFFFILIYMTVEEWKNLKYGKIDYEISN